jgi:FAD/FMN-containing dehydrogenase
VQAELAQFDPAWRPYIFGHLADGNLHIILNQAGPLPPERALAVEHILYRHLQAMGGSFSAEHGIGVEKQATLLRLVSPAKLALMQAVKRAYDPHGIMNPGKVLPTAPVVPSAG